jgi:hypothetical protein
MRGRWNAPGGKQRIALRSELRENERPSDRTPSEMEIDRWLANPAAGQILGEIHGVISGQSTQSLARDGKSRMNAAIKRALMHAFDSGELVFVESTKTASRASSGSGGSSTPSNTSSSSGGAGAKGGGASSSSGPETKKVDKSSASGNSTQSSKTWIEIELLDEDGKPAAGEKYKIVLTDGSVQQGSLDAQGKARWSGIDPGTCKVSFPDLDASAWSRA